MRFEDEGRQAMIPIKQQQHFIRFFINIDFKSIKKKLNSLRISGKARGTQVTCFFISSSIASGESGSFTALEVVIGGTYLKIFSNSFFFYP